MGFRFPIIFLLLALSVADGISAAGHSAAPPPSGDCSSLVLNMADCLTYVVAGGTAAKPEGTCCSGLKTVLKTDPQCLCETFRNSAQLGITLNMTKAMSLPAACHVDAPAATSCAVSPGIAAAPALSPMALSPSSVAGAPTAAGAGATFGGAPAPTPGSSTSSAPAVSIELLVFTSLAAVAAYALF